MSSLLRVKTMKMIIKTRYFNNINGNWMQPTIHVSVLYFANVDDMQNQRNWLGKIIWEGDVNILDYEIDIPAPPEGETYLFLAVAPDGTYSRQDPYPYIDDMIIYLDLFPPRIVAPEPEPTSRVLKPKLTRKKNRKKSED